MSEHHHEDDFHVHPHITPTKVNIAVLGALLVLTGLTVAAYNVRLGEWNLLVAILIAAIKSSVVMTWFMHMKHEKLFNAIIFLGSVVFAGVFLFYTMNDTGTRNSVGEFEGARIDASRGSFAAGTATNLIDQGNEVVWNNVKAHTDGNEVRLVGIVTDDVERQRVAAEHAKSNPGKKITNELLVWNDQTASMANPHFVRFERRGSQLHASGLVPSEELHASIVEKLSTDENMTLVDMIRVSGGSAPAGFGDVVLGSEKAPGMCSMAMNLADGFVSLSDGNVRVRGYGDMDGQSEALKSSLPKGYNLMSFAVEPTIAGDACAATLQQKMAGKSIHFDTGSDHIAADSFGLLFDLANTARACPSAKLIVGGHTDNVGEPAMNKRLSKLRAASVKRHLAGLGVYKHRLLARGYGDARPVAPNATEEGRAKNRRIEFALMN